MNVSCKLLLLCMLLSSVCAAQPTNDWQKVLQSAQSKQQKIKSLDSIIAVNSPKNEALLERLTHKYAIWLYRNKEINKAIQTAQYSLEIKKKHYASDTALLRKGLNNLAFFLYKDRKISKSIQYYQKIVDLNSEDYATAVAYSDMGRCYRDLGDYYRSITHFELAQSIFQKNNYHEALISNSINANRSYLNLNSKAGYQKSTENLLLADSLSYSIETRLTDKFKTKLALGNLYNQIGNLDTNASLRYYEQGLQIAEQVNDSSQIAMIYGLIGNLYNIIDLNKSIAYQKTALTYCSPQNRLQKTICYLNIASCQIRLEKFDEGIDFYYDAINEITAANLNKETGIKDSDKLYQSFNTPEILNSLKSIAIAYLKQSEKTQNKEKNYKEIIDIFLIADKLLDLMRIESKEFQSKLYWRQQSATLYGRAIETCFLANDIDNAFYFMEKNKAFLLSEDINKSAMRQSLELPTHLVNSEIELKKSIYLLEHQKKDTQASQDSIAIKIINTKRKLQQLQDSIQRSFPDYEQLLVQSPIASLQEIRESLDANTVLVEYNISEHEEVGPATTDTYIPFYPNCLYGQKKVTNGYLLVISKENVQFLNIENTTDLENNITTLAKLAATPFANKKDIANYNAMAYKVYDQLFPTDPVKSLLKNKTLRIIPDNYLNYLPFEALITSNKSDKSTYLIEDCEVSYLYSNSFLKATKNRKNRTDNEFLGIAPQNFDTYGLPPLDDTGNEISGIEHYFSGKTYTLKQATKANFLEALPNYNLIHLATHADAQDSISPWIAFSNQKLYLEELYFTKNNADLVVLSGCNTLQGKQETGEGVMSLSRGFFHSGARSVVSSLWSVDDRSTTFIMKEFYKQLKKGISKSEALRTAKLTYLKQHSQAVTAPHFWATFVLSGDTSPINTTSMLSNNGWYILIAVLGLLFLLIGGFWKFKKRNA